MQALIHILFKNKQTNISNNNSKHRNILASVSFEFADLH